MPAEFIQGRDQDMTTTSASNDTFETATPPTRLEAARDKVLDAAGAAKNAGVDGFAAAREKAGDSLASAREKATTVLGDVKERASSAFDTARGTATDATRRAADGIDDNPVAAIVGGLALGALAAAILPKTEREAAAFGAIGERVNAVARDAAAAAKSAGKDKLDELGLNKDNARDTVGKLVGEVATAVTSAGTAAVNSAKSGGDTKSGDGA